MARNFARASTPQVGKLRQLRATVSDRTLSRRRSQAAGDVVGHVSDEKVFELMGDFARGRGNFVAGDFADADNVAVSGGDEYFVGGVKIFRTKRVLNDGDASFGRDLKQNAARYPFEAAGV